MNFQEHFIGSSVLVTFESKLLLLHRDPNAPTNPNRWGIIGGGRENTESPLETALREMREETTVVPTDIRYIEQLRDVAVYVYHSPLSRVEADQVRLNGEGDELKFFSLPELDTIPLSTYVTNSILPQFREFLEKVLI